MRKVAWRSVGWAALLAVVAAPMAFGTSRIQWTQDVTLRLYEIQGAEWLAPRQAVPVMAPAGGVEAGHGNLYGMGQADLVAETRGLLTRLTDEGGWISVDDHWRVRIRVDETDLPQAVVETATADGAYPPVSFLMLAMPNGARGAVLHGTGDPQVSYLLVFDLVPAMDIPGTPQ